MIIGLTGKYAAGKGTVAELLMARGFVYHSLSDVLRAELRRRAVAESRETLLALGNELRGRHGPGALAELIGAELEVGGHQHLVDSIRNPAEVSALRKRSGFVLLGIDADPRVRFERLRARGRQGDPTTWEAFRALEDKETQSDNPAAQQLAATFALADHVLMNDGTPEELGTSVAEWLTRLGWAPA